MVRLSVNRAWDETLAFLRSDRRLIVPVLLAFMILPAVLYRLAVPVPDDMAAVLEGSGPPPWAGLLGYLLVFISFVGILTLILLALGRKEPLGQLIALSARRCLTLLLSLILFGLLMVPLGLVLVLPTRGDMATNPAQLPPQAFAAVGLLMIVMLLVLFRLFLLFPVSAAERAGPWQGLKRGWTLGRGNGLKLVGTFALLFLSSITVSYVINQVGGTFATLVLDGDRGMTVGSLVVGLIAASATAAFQAVQAGMLGSFYRQAVEGTPLSG